jgi:hypothetical protein
MLAVDPLYTWFLWMSAFGFASAGIFVWAIPTMFNELSRPKPMRMRRRQAIYSATSLALAAFLIFYACNQYPDIHRSWVDMVWAGPLAFMLSLMALSGWIQLMLRAVSRMGRRDYSDPASVPSN